MFASMIPTLQLEAVLTLKLMEVVYVLETILPLPPASEKWKEGVKDI